MTTIVCRYCLLACLVPVLLALFAEPVGALETVTLQLKWTHAFQFAGYYAAREKGFYREAGLDVRILEARPGIDPVKVVLDRTADFGVGTSSLLLQRKAGNPVVVLAAIFQHSPYLLITRRLDISKGIHDLVGKRVMLEPQAEELLAFLKNEGISLDSITVQEHSYDPLDLIRNNTDAIAAYIINQPYYLDKAGFFYQTYSPRSAGIDFYGDNLFTTERLIKDAPGTVEAFRSASLRGWKYAMAHPEEIADLIIARYSQEHSRNYYLFQSQQMLPLIQPDLVEIGYMNPARWRHIADTYAGLGLLPRDVSLDGFLYDVQPLHFKLIRLYGYLGGALALMVVTSFIAIYVYRINRRLARIMATNSRIETTLRSLSVAVEQSPLSVVITDLNGVIEYVNPRFTDVTGYAPEEVIGKNPRILHSGQTDPSVFKELWTELRQGHIWTGEFINKRKDGGLFCEEAHIAPVFDESGTITRYVAVKLDISERKWTQEELRLSEERHRLLADNASDVIWTMDIEGHFTYVSPSVEKLRGYTAAEVMQQSLNEVLTPESAVIVLEELGRAFEAVRTGSKFPEFRGELEQPCKDGSTVWTEVTTSGIYNEAGEFVGILGVTRDISERRKAEDQITHLAQHDTLTDLPNRALFSDRLQQALARARRDGVRLALMFLDLDRFKPINDTYGHAMGDLLLQEAAQRMQECIRASDTVGRIGGDEFVVLLPKLDGESVALLVAEKLRFALAEPFVLGGHALNISASIGIAMYPEHGLDERELYHSADLAMYCAKQNGRNTVLVFKDEMRERCYSQEMPALVGADKG